MNWLDLLRPKRLRESSSLRPDDYRNEFEKDYHRIIASASFRRLQDKTQVFPLDQSDFIRTRLTHSLEVSSLAKSLGQTVAHEIRFRGLDQSIDSYTVAEISDLLLCAGLIHDIGNPPFGHYGETTIRDWFKAHLAKLKFGEQPLTDLLYPQMLEDFYHFEGNAQALRLVSKLHFLRDEYGMNLTLPLLNTVIKYPVSSLSIDEESEDIRCHKMGYFYAERDLYEKIVQTTGCRQCRHPLTYILEAADDIAYRTADIEDAFIKGRFTFGEFQEALQQGAEKRAMTAVQRDCYDYHYRRLETFYRYAKEENLNKPDFYALQNWMVYLQGCLLKEAADAFCRHYPAIMDGRFEDSLFFDTESALILKILGDIAVDFVFTSKQIISLEISANKIIGGLLDMFVPAAIHWDTGELRPSLEPRLMAIISDNYRSAYFRWSEGAAAVEKLYLRLLLVTDYICGMTDSFAKTMYRKMNGNE